MLKITIKNLVFTNPIKHEKNLKKFYERTAHNFSDWILLSQHLDCLGFTLDFCTKSSSQANLNISGVHGDSKPITGSLIPFSFLKIKFILLNLKNIFL